MLSTKLRIRTNLRIDRSKLRKVVANLRTGYWKLRILLHVDVLGFGFNQERRIIHVLHGVENSAEAKLRQAVVFGLKTQAVKNQAASIPQKINHIFLSPDMVHDDVLVAEIFLNPSHI